MTFLVSLLGTDMLGFFLMLEQKGAVSFSLYDIARALTIPGWGVVIILLLMSIYIIAIGIERYMTYNAAKQQSRQFAPKVAQAL